MVVGNIYPGIFLGQAVLAVLPFLCLSGLLVVLSRLKIEFQNEKTKKRSKKIAEKIVFPCLCLGGLMVALLQLKIEFQNKKSKKFAENKLSCLVYVLADCW